MLTEPLTAMTRQERDPSLDREWINENMDRMLGYEILQRCIRAQYQEMDAVELEDAVGADYGLCTRIIKKTKSLIK